MYVQIRFIYCESLLSKLFVTIHSLVIHNNIECDRDFHTLMRLHKVANAIFKSMLILVHVHSMYVCVYVIKYIFSFSQYIREFIFI